MNNYTRKYIDDSLRQINQHISTYKKLKAAVTKQNEDLLHTAIKPFEPVFFNNMVLVLDSYFTHRSRTIEGKDGNPLNEVRVLCNSLLHNNSIMSMDKSVKIIPGKTVLKYKTGENIQLHEEDFSRLFKAFFVELESKYL